MSPVTQEPSTEVIRTAGTVTEQLAARFADRSRRPVRIAGVSVALGVAVLALFGYLAVYYGGRSTLLTAVYVIATALQVGLLAMPVRQLCALRRRAAASGRIIAGAPMSAEFRPVDLSEFSPAGLTVNVGDQRDRIDLDDIAGIRLDDDVLVLSRKPTGLLGGRRAPVPVPRELVPAQIAEDYARRFPPRR